MPHDPPIEHYSAKRIPNPNPSGELPWQEYQATRNAVLRSCRKFGRVGPMGECAITDDPEPPWDRRWPVGDNPCDFFVLDDQYNDELYIYLEIVTGEVFTEAWLREMMHALDELPGWGIGVKGLPGGYMLVFADKIMVTGGLFRSCTDFASVVHRTRAALTMRR